MPAPRPDPFDADREAALNAWRSVVQAALPFLFAIAFFWLGWRCAEIFGSAG